MHLRSFLLLGFLLVCISLKAQFHITPQVGYTFATIKQYEDYYVNINSQAYDKIKPAFGLLASRQIAPDFRLQTDFFYTQRGTNVVGSRFSDYDWFDVNSKHMDIGIQLSYTKIQNVEFEAGFYYSQLLEITIDEYSGWRRPYLLKIDGKMYYNNETGASLGVSYTLYNITARAKYSLGIWGTREAEKNHWFLLSLGYRFEI